MRLTEGDPGADYSCSYELTYVIKSMTNKSKEAESPVVFLKDETARQRWELFHRAIAHAKQSNDAALDDVEAEVSDPKSSGPLLSIVR